MSDVLVSRRTRRRPSVVDVSSSTTRLSSSLTSSVSPQRMRRPGRSHALQVRASAARGCTSSTSAALPPCRRARSRAGKTRLRLTTTRSPVERVEVAEGLWWTRRARSRTADSTSRSAEAPGVAPGGDRVELAERTTRPSVKSFCLGGRVPGAFAQVLVRAPRGHAATRGRSMSEREGARKFLEASTGSIRPPRGGDSRTQPRTSRWSDSLRRRRRPCSSLRAGRSASRATSALWFHRREPEHSHARRRAGSRGAACALDGRSRQPAARGNRYSPIGHDELESSG